MNNIELTLPTGVQRAEFIVQEDTMEALGRAVGLLLADVNHNKYGVGIDSLDVCYTPLVAYQEGVVRVSWSKWACRITLWRK